MICDAFGGMLLVSSFWILSQLLIGRAERNVFELFCRKKKKDLFRIL